MSINVFCDMDGVLTDWDSHVSSIIGRPSKAGEKLSIAEWKMLEDHPDYFGTMKPLPGAVEFFNELRILGVNAMLLSLCPGNFVAKAANQKRRWRNVHLGTDVLFIPVVTHKSLYIQKPGDVLLDDQNKHIQPWNASGGHGIWFNDRTYDSVIQEIKTLL